MLPALATVGRRTGRVVTASLVLAVIGFGTLVGVPKLLGFQTYAITSGSMAGTADRGALVIAEPVPVADLVVGDVITYLPPGESGLAHPVTHRLVDIDVQADGTRVMRTQGDANAAADPWSFVLDGDTQLRMRASVAHAGVPVLALGQRSVRLLVVGLPAAVIGLLSLAEMAVVLRDPREREGSDTAPTAVPGRTILVLDDAAAPLPVPANA